MAKLHLLTHSIRPTKIFRETTCFAGVAFPFLPFDIKKLESCRFSFIVTGRGEANPGSITPSRPNQLLGYRTTAEVYAVAVENTRCDVVKSTAKNFVGVAGLFLK